MNLLIHVGLHKTATTFLQDHVFCKQAYGFCAAWGKMSHAAVQQFVTVDPLHFDASQVREVFAAGMDQARQQNLVPVITHEALSSRPHEGLYYSTAVAERLVQTFPEAKIVIGIREQKGMLASLYAQYVRNGGRVNIRSFLGTGEEPLGWAPPCRLDFFEYDRFVSHYQTLFGGDRVLVLPMEWLRKDYDRYITQLLDFAGVQASQKPVNVASNQSWGGATLAFFRACNRLTIRNPLGPRQPWGVRMSQNLCWKIDRYIPQAWHAHFDRKIKEYVHQRVGHHFAASNTKLARLINVDLAALGYPVA